jgi:hypothetical protein
MTRAAFSSGAAAFVWTVWLVGLLASLFYVAHFGRNVPYFDDWEIVPALTGARPVTASRLWSQHHEHRIPLPRLVLLALYRISNNDFRAGMYFNAFALAGLAAALIVAVRTVRGSTHYADAFFPVALLNWGHCENLLWSWQVGFLVSVVLAGAVLVLIVTDGGRARFRTLLLTAMCLLLLPLCGANGLAFVPGLALWVLYEWRVAGREGRVGKGAGLLVIGMAAGALLLSGLYFVGYQRTEIHPASPSFSASIRTAVQFLGMSVGPGLLPPEFAPWRLLCTSIVTVFVFLATALLVWSWHRHSDERVRIVGLLLYLAGVVCLALAIGWGRAGLEPDAGLQGRYVTLAVLALCWTYFVLVIYGKPIPGRWPIWALFGLVCVMLPFNTQVGLGYGKHQQARLDAFMRDVKSGLPPFALAYRYSELPEVVYPYPREFASYLSLLRQAGIGEFATLATDPPLREVALTPENSFFGQDSTVTLKKPEFVYAIRLTYYFPASDARYVTWHLCWTSDSQQSFSLTERNARLILVPRANQKSVVIWVNDRVAQLQLQLRRPEGGTRIPQLREIVLLLPDKQ